MRIRPMVTAALTGVFLVASAWAGVGLAPVRAPEPSGAPRDGDAAARQADLGVGDTLGGDELLAGAAKIDIKPLPDSSKGEAWVRDKRKCTPLTSGDINETLAQAPDARMPWPENTSCIYMGGFGLGPTQPVLDWDDYTSAPVYDASGNVTLRGYGLWVRSVAFLRPDATGATNAVVLTILDSEGYFAAYDRMCPPEKACGIFDLQQQLAGELGLAPGSFVFASTHSHSSLDLIGGWGGVPVWYMRQVAEALRESARRAVANAEPATLEAGETLARHLNGERRDTYRSAEDPSINWVRALSRPDASGNRRGIATAATYAAHPTSFGGGASLAHADYPGVFAKRAEERFGGIGLMFPAGLGNMSTRGGYRIGAPLADLLPPAGAGTLVTNPVVRVKQEQWDQPVTNGPLGSLGAAKIFDRSFGGPAAVSIAKTKWDDSPPKPSNKPCTSASAISIRTSVTSARVGGVYITAAPGEIFANFTNTIEERAPITALAIGQANDAVGYMPQSFETDHVARQGPGFVGADLVEYEDAYSIDHCFGDMALETQLKLLSQIKT